MPCCFHGVVWWERIPESEVTAFDKFIRVSSAWAKNWLCRFLNELVAAKCRGWIPFGRVDDWTKFNMQRKVGLKHCKYLHFEKWRMCGKYGDAVAIPRSIVARLPIAPILYNHLATLPQCCCNTVIAYLLKQDRNNTVLPQHCKLCGHFYYQRVYCAANLSCNSLLLPFPGVQCLVSVHWWIQCMCACQLLSRP